MASKYGGYMGEALWVDLTASETRPYDVSERDRELFIGNKGLAAKILWDHLEPGIDPLGPENLLVVTTSPLTGTGAPCSARFNVSTKSPMTGGIVSSNSGGGFGIQLKRAGFDALVLAGQADKPVYVEINDGESTIHDAADIWGMDTEEVQEELRKRHGKAAGLLVIGPAGENLVRFACIISGERANGRGGVGAVMGSKMVKAVVATGKQKASVSHPEEYKTVIKAWIKMLKAHPATGQALPAYGTAGMMGKGNVLSILPTKNFQKGSFEFTHEIDGEALADKYLTRNTGCQACPIRCQRNVEINGKEVKGPEYETIGMFGSNFGNRDLWKICEWNYIADKLGVDTISCGSTIDCAVELTERGLMKTDLAWGKTEGVDELLRQIAYREGIGDDLAEGAMRLATKYGAPDAAMHSKGLEMAAYEPRRSVGQGLGYATASRGACHLEAGYMVYFENLGPVNIKPLSLLGKIGLTIFQQNALAAISACGTCIFTSYAIVPGIAEKVKPYGALAKVLDLVLRGTGDAMSLLFKLPPGAVPFHLPMIPHSKAVETLTGMKHGAGEFLAMGNRVFNIEHMFNVREGLVANRLPDRMTKVPQSPTNPDTVVPLDAMLPKFYKGRGWDARGIPTAGTLRALGLDFLIGAIPPANEQAEAMQSTFESRREEYEKDQVKVIATRAQKEKAPKKKAAPVKKKAAPKKATPKKKAAPVKKTAVPVKKKAAPAKKKATPVKKKVAKKKK
ncbi:MAG: aldehyde ferredoxin oxidoreductase family protein [Candidatus Lernaella stagnicola]|nr:aldehyde ferredoxin oxidoreductase family protein [Candidatus Lernaella stagnicola]